MSRAFGSRVTPGEAFTNNLGVGAMLGAGAFVVNYVVTFLFVTIDGVEYTQTSLWKGVGRIFYNAHFVATEQAGGGITDSYNALAYVTPQSDLTSTVPLFLYHTVPELVLIAAGLLAVQQAGSKLSTEAAVAVGTTVTAGYLALSLVGVFLFEESFQGTAVAPELVTGVVLAGVVYPVLFGGLGGAIGD